MRVVSLGELGTLGNVHMTALFAMNQRWKEGHTFFMRKPRRQSALLWFCGARGLFILEGGEELSVPRGALVSIPQGSRYSLRFSECDSIATVLLECCFASGDEPFVLSEKVEILDEHLEERQMTDIVRRLPSIYKMPSRPQLLLKSEFCKLLYLLSSREERRMLIKRGFKVIEAGIRYLENDEEQRLTVEEIAEMCFVTPAYFRRLFHKYAGMSPAAYRTKRKIERAKELMERSEISVAELSDLLGYDNPSYFFRVFKKETGISPSEYRRSFVVDSIEK